jgi:hypothetical protein
LLLFTRLFVTRFFIPGRKERKVPSAAIIMGWDFLFEGGGSNFEESYGFKAQDFENQESQINADL